MCHSVYKEGGLDISCNHGRGGAVMWLMVLYLITIIAGPVVFYLYYQKHLVCEPRAILSSIIFGMVPFSFFLLSHCGRIRGFYAASVFILCLEAVTTPVIMIGKLGMDRFVNDRLLAFFTFEAFIAIQLCFVLQISRSHRR